MEKNVQTQAIICDKAAYFWKARVLGASRANLQVAVGAWDSTDSEMNLFSHPNSHEVGMHLIIKGSLKLPPLESSNIVAMACTCSNIKSMSIRTYREATVQVEALIWVA